MDDQPTCGKGLAEHSALPAKLGELMAAMADTLDVHQRTLDLTDENAKKELDAYLTLATDFHSIAAALQATAMRMAGYRTLPMAKHDEQAMAGPKVVHVFANFVRLEQEVLALVEEALERDQKMLDAMKHPPA